MANERIESLPALEFDHLLSKFFLNPRRKNGAREEYELATISSFHCTIKRNLRTLAPKMFPHTDFFLHLPRRKVKKRGGHRFRFAEDMPGRTP